MANYVMDTEIYSAQSYLMRVTDKCYITPLEKGDCEWIREILDENGYDHLWDYPLDEIDHIVENNLKVVLVDCCEWDENGNMIHEPRWFEVEEVETEEPRICSVCGKEMWQGYCVGDGDDYYCSDECLHTVYTPKEWEEMYETDQGYYTEWEK